MILDKILKVLTSLLLFKTDLDIMFDDILNRKQCFLYYNKNTLSSIEPMGLGDKLKCCQRRWCCYTNFSFGIQNESYMS